MSPPKMSPAGLIFLLVLSCSLFTSPRDGLADPGATPAPEAGPGLSMTWADILKRVDEHPRLSASRYEQAAARAAVEAAGAVPNPSIEASAAYGRARDGSASAFEWGIGLSIPFDWVAQRGARIDAAGAGEQVARAESRSLRREVLQALRVLFWNLVYEQERVAALGALGEKTSELAAMVNRRVDKGAGRPVEAVRMEVEAEKIAGELAAARLTLAARRAQLGAWLGLSPDRPITVVADLESLPEPTTQAQALAEVRRGHPALAAARARVAERTGRLEVERRARLPGAFLEAFTDHELDRRAYGVGLALDLPVWNWNSGGIRRAQAALDASREQVRAARLELETETIAAQGKCRAGIGLAARYKEQVLPRARSVAQTIEKTYELGEATLIEVVDARRTLLDTQQQYLATLVQAHIDCSRLAALTGEELP